MRDGSSNQQSPLEYYQLVAIINENSPSAAFKVLNIAKGTTDPGVDCFDQ